MVRPKGDKIGGNLRPSFLFLFFGILAGIAGWRLFGLQIENHSTYKAIAQKQHLREIKIEATRGRIFFSDEETPLADNRGVYELAITPKEIQDPKYLAEILGKILNEDPQDLYFRISNKEKSWIVLKNDLSLKEGEALRGIPGVYLKNVSQGYYPQKEMASQTVGFFGETKEGKKGRYGIEEYWDQKLRGKDGRRIVMVDGRGGMILPFIDDKEEKIDGCDLVTTLDFNIQLKAEEILLDLEKKFSPKESTIIVSDPITGDILAMASRPSFDPNLYFENTDYEIFKNPALSPFEPGSIFKPITMAGALEEGVVSPNTSYIDRGEVRVDERTLPIRNADRKAHGQKTMTEVLELSLNTGAVFVQQKLGGERFVEYIQRFGFGKKTGIEVAGEREGSLQNILKPRSGEKLIEFANASFGQGISVNSIQLVQAFSTIANQGRLVKPRIAKKLICPNGEEVFLPKYGQRVISAETASRLVAMMVSTVEKGYGKKAKVKGYLIAGKTGTAQIPDPEKGGYLSDRTIHSFGAFAPAFEPRFLIFLKMDHPKGIRFAADSLAPSAGEMARYLFSYFGIASTEDVE